MAEQMKPGDLVTLQELAVSSAYEIAALVGVLERKGIVTRAEMRDEIKRLGDKSGKAR
jgi:hypothetical protein